MSNQEKLNQLINEIKAIKNFLKGNYNPIYKMQLTPEKEYEDTDDYKITTEFIVSRKNIMEFMNQQLEIKTKEFIEINENVLKETLN